jgi:hypothetical protein
VISFPLTLLSLLFSAYPLFPVTPLQLVRSRDLLIEANFLYWIRPSYRKFSVYRAC